MSDPTNAEQGMAAPATGMGDGRPQFPCEKCGAKLEFAPGTSSLRCPYCGHENPIDVQPGEGEARIEEIDFHSQLAALEEQAGSAEILVVKCDGCGAEVVSGPNVVAMPCPFCGTNIVATTRSAKLIKPASLLPFLVPKDVAVASFRKWLKGLWFAPSKVKRLTQVDQRLAGIYMPAWTYDCATTTDYSGYRGDHYYVTVGSGKNRRRERRTRWSPRSGTVHNRFDDVLVLASESLPRKLAGELEPWDLHDLVPYKDDYLSGFAAESYQVDLGQGFEIAKGLMEPHIRATVCGDIGGDVQKISSMRVEYEGITFKHLLLPLWVSGYRFKNKVYRFLVNARTGEVQGDRPWSWIKITLAVLGGLALVAIIILIVQAMNK